MGSAQLCFLWLSSDVESKFHGAALQGCVPELDQSLMLSTLLLFPQPAQGSVMDMLHLKFTPLISLMDSLMYHEPSSVV